MGHTEEAVGHGSHVSGFGVAAGQGDGGHEVLYVVPPGDADAGNIQHGGLGDAVFGRSYQNNRSLPLVDGGVPAGGVDRVGEIAVGQIPRARKPGHGGGQSLTDTAGVLVPRVEDGGLGEGLTAQKVGLGGDILGHVGVPVEVVGGDVGQRPAGHARPLAHGHELEAGQLHHGEIVRGHVLRKRQERGTDVAPTVDLARAPPLAGLLQNEGDHGGGGGLTVGARNGDNLRFGQGQEQLHLGGEDGSRFYGGLNFGEMGTDAGGAEYDALGQVLEVAFTADKMRAEGLQAGGVPALFHILGGTLIPYRNAFRAVGDQPLHQRSVGDSVA